MNTDIFDLIIIGGGPIGLTCGIAAQRAGLKYLILEKGMLVNSLYHFPTNMTFFSTADLLEIGNIPFMTHGAKPTRAEALDYFRHVQKKWKTNIHYYEPVQKIKQPEAENPYFRIQTNQRTYQAQKIIIATGFYDIPRRLNVKGEDLPKVSHYYSDSHPYIGQRVLVVGAGNSGCIAALELHRKGIEVALLVRHPTIKPSVKYWIKPDIENRIKSGAIPTFFNAQLTEIGQREVVIKNADGRLVLPNDKVLALTGYQPDFAFLKNAGIWLLNDPYRSPMHNTKTLESNVKGIYLAGVICAGLETGRLFIENTRLHADIIIQDILKKKEGAWTI